MITFQDHLTESLSMDPEIRALVDVIKTANMANREKNIDTVRSVIQALQQRGFDKIGQGSRAMVFGKPGYPFVIKFFVNDKGYAAWANYARDNSDNPYVPKIRGQVHWFPKSTIGFVRLEKLSPITKSEWKKFSDSYFKNTSRDPHLARIHAWIFNHVQGLGDIKQDNIMKRADGHLVVTDPVVIR